MTFVGKLQIERAQESDMGKYECVATNDVGVAHSNGAHVYVKGKILLVMLPVKVKGNVKR